MSDLINGKYNNTITQTVQSIMGKSWSIEDIRKIEAGAMHPIAIFKGTTGSVFVKAGNNSYSYDQFQKEATGLTHIRAKSGIRTPEIYGVVKQDDTILLIMEAIKTVPVETKKDWEVIGHGLATLHKTTAHQCGFFQDNYLGVWPQKNDYRDNWLDFYADVRLHNMVDMTIATGHLLPEECNWLERIIKRLPAISGPEQPFSLLHGDPWTSNTEHGNLLYDGKQLILIDSSMYYGNREIDLSTVDLFCPVNNWFFEAYHEAYPIETGYKERKELWRLNQRISFVGLFGRELIAQLMDEVNKYL